MEDSEAVQNGDQPTWTKSTNYDESQGPDDEDARYLQHSKQLLSIFPKEVWDHICSFLDSATFQNLNNSSFFFRQLFLRKRVTFLYKPVLKILLKTLVKPEEKNGLRECPFMESQPISTFLGTSRLVCKKWKRAIDEMASFWNVNDESGEEKSAENYFLRSSYNCLLNTDFNKINNFITHFNNTHLSTVNPFIGRSFSIEVIVAEVPIYLEMFNKISVILAKYGQHLKNCELHIVLTEVYQPEIYKSMINWLNFMPNLDALKIYYYFRKTSNDPSNFTGQTVVPSEPKGLKKLIVNANSNHEIADWSWIQLLNLSQLIRKQNKLEYLEIVMRTRNDFQILKEIKSPLKTLKAQYHYQEDNINLSDIFTTYSENFYNSLESLSIFFSKSWNSRMHLLENFFCSRLNLPKVKKFVIAIQCYLSSLDFLLGMRENLEEFKVYYCVKCPCEVVGDINSCMVDRMKLMENKQIIKFLGYQEKMLESNIWDLFPKLQTICLIVSGTEMVYKRMDYMKSQKVI